MQEQENKDLRMQYERLGRTVTAIEAEAYLFPPSRGDPTPDQSPATDAPSIPGATPAESNSSPEATTKTKKKKKEIHLMRPARPSGRSSKHRKLHRAGMRRMGKRGICCPMGTRLMMCMLL